MKRVLISLLIMSGIGLMVSAAVAQPNDTKLVNPRDRTIYRDTGSKLLAATSPASGSPNLELTVEGRQQNNPLPYLEGGNPRLYPDGTVRVPRWTWNGGEAGLLGRYSVDLYAPRLHLSLFPRDEFDRDSELGVYVQLDE